MTYYDFYNDFLSNKNGKMFLGEAYSVGFFEEKENLRKELKRI